MTKAELVKVLARASGVTRRSVEDILEETFLHIAHALGRGERFVWPGFGAWRPCQRKARRVLHPDTGRSIPVRAFKAVGFRASKNLKTLLERAARRG